MARKYGKGRNRPSWARFFNDWKNPSQWFSGQERPIEDEIKPIGRAKAIKRKSPVISTPHKVLKCNKIEKP